MFLTIFLVKSKLSTAKKSKTTTFSRVFHPKNRQFSREIKVEFLDKKWRFRTVCSKCILHNKSFCNIWSILCFDPLVFCCLIKSIFASRLSLTICSRRADIKICVIELMNVRKCTQCIAYQMMDSHGNALNLGRGYIRFFFLLAG